MIEKKDRKTLHAVRGNIPSVRLPRNIPAQNKSGASKASLPKGADKP